MASAYVASMIELEQVTKRFGTHLAVDHFDLKIPEGSVFGFIGPNGSGKTTTLRMVLRIIEPDSGNIRVFNKSNHISANDSIGYLPEERGLYRKMTVIRQLMYFGRLKGMANKAARQSALEWLERLDLLEWKDKKLETLSKGMSQKIQFITTVLARPRLLILDEPFSGLDPVNLDLLRTIILEMRDAGTTLVFSTHDMHVAERLCDHICMIYKGRKVLDGSLDSIQADHGQNMLRLRYQDGTRLQTGELPGVSDLRQTGRFYEMRFSGDPNKVLMEAVKVGKVDHFQVIHPSLHDIFVDIAKPEEKPVSTKEELDNA